MGPSCRGRTRSTKKWSSRRVLFKGSNNTHHKKKSPANESPVKVSPESEEPPKDIRKNVAASPDSNASNICYTPKAKKYRIPDIKTCPPAPRKRRMLTTCSSKRSPVAFCTPEDIEVLFYLALGDAPQ